MTLPEEFLTLSASFETKFKEKGSLFIGQAYPIVSGENAEELLQGVRKKYYDATHHCFAYSLLSGEVKYSDDGEPSGTAGIRILNAVQHFNLQNILVVVIRYYGGVKLGVGPLGKAYYNSAQITLADAPKVKRTSYKKYKIIFDFPMAGQVHHTLSLFQAKIVNTEYSEKTEIEFLVSLKNELAFLKKKEEILREDAKLSDLHEIMFL